MKLYEIDLALENLLLQIEPDPETGEIPMNYDEICEQINALSIERTRILEYLAKLVLNTRSDITSLKAEEKRLHDRRSSLEKKEERLMEILDRECGGQKTDCGVATVSYRKTTKVDITDNVSALHWLEDNGHDDFIRYSDPEISKSDVKRLLTNGTEIPGITLKNDYSCSLR